MGNEKSKSNQTIIQNKGYMNMHKCEFTNGITIKPDGVHELDPCIYQEIEKYANVTISIRKCKNCGNIDIVWYRQDDTEELETE